MSERSAEKPLRERRRNEGKRAIQAAALDLFEASSFAAVTMEQIAAASGVGVATVYRYFGSKEQVVLWDEYDPMIFSAVGARAAGGTLLEELTAALVASVDAVYGADAKRILRRTRLINAEPALRQASVPGLEAMVAGLADALLRSRACRGRLEAEVVAGAVAAALQTAVRHWEQSDAKKPLAHHLRAALAKLGRLTGMASETRP